MTRLLITGANGFVGRALCDQAASRGYTVRCATRAAWQSGSCTENAVVGTIGATTDWTEALKGVEVVIRLAALLVDSGKICREPNWSPPYILQQGLQATVAWHRHALL